MPYDSSAPIATLWALYGETDLLIIAPALGDRWFARMLALAPGVHPIVGAPSASAGECQTCFHPPYATHPRPQPSSRP